MNLIWFDFVVLFVLLCFTYIHDSTGEFIDWDWGEDISSPEVDFGDSMAVCDAISSSFNSSSSSLERLKSPGVNPGGKLVTPDAWKPPGPPPLYL